MNDPTALVRRLYRAQLRGETQAVLDLLAENVTWSEPDGTPWEGLYVGQKAVAAVIDQVDADWRNWVERDEVYLAGGDTVVVRGTCYGTYRATGLTMETKFVDVWVVKQGKVQKVERTLESEPIAEAMGLLAA
jgi:ketosteroid isomerase-like protein